ncbi:hypothetical protein [Methylobacterium sp. Leaf87]|uniref:hypothetical protein n=1 Tax=Methylobacterium sp. Leaf87 TaxID=1736243 RepID=UPI000A53DA93|nr:hypothetical protein [Methylobacterium sp. Leaf87]
MNDTQSRLDIERIIRSTGGDPEALAWAADMKRKAQLPYTSIHNDPADPAVQPLVTSLTNKNNVTNGYTHVAAPLADVSHVIPADAIELTEDSNTLAPTFITPGTQLNNNDQLPETGDGAHGAAEGDTGPSCPTLPTPFYLKVDVFDNGAGKPGKSKGNRYKIKIHFNLEDQGNQYELMGAFHPETRGFRNNVPDGYENDPFYKRMDDELYEYNRADEQFIIRPLGAKFKDTDNKTVLYTAAIVFWIENEINPCVILDLQGFRHTIDLTGRPKSATKNNLLAYGVWVDPARKTKAACEDKKGGNTLLETIRLVNQGIK